MTGFVVRDGGLERRTAGEILRVEPWGPHGVRVRAAVDALDLRAEGALLPEPPSQPESWLAAGDGTGQLANGRLTVVAGADGLLRFQRTAGGEELLAERVRFHRTPGPRVFAPRGDGAYRVEQQFRAYEQERLYGLGQHPHGRLDQKGCVLDLVQDNTVVSIPFLHSSRGYGLLWNVPAAGRVELGADATRWVAQAAGQLDYWVTAGDTPAQVMESYADVTGHPPLLPQWATGFWQSRLRYRTQAELLAVAREHHRRGLPLSVIVCDFFHWPRMGDWRFDENDWPDPAAMIAELDQLGVKLAVSIWPTVDEDSESYPSLRAAGQLVRDAHGGLLTSAWPAGGDRFAPMAYYDATDPAARQALWDRVRASYLSLGVGVFWLDACEPDMPPRLAARARYAAGPGPQVGHLYPLRHAQGFFEGQRAAGVERPLSLIRAAWAGSQRYGIALWSGDIETTFESLAVQVRAGLNVAMSGIPWWHTDIGGFDGGDPADPAYRELLVRWFQYGTFLPVMRLHGDREPRQPFTAEIAGGPNEVWSYGEDAYEILREQLLLRERLRPYLQAQAQVAHDRGIPPMRPLFFDFPDDPAAWEVDDQFLLGPDLLVAPVTRAGARSRPVYLPAGASWRELVTGKVHRGGSELAADAPLEQIPVFVRDGADPLVSAG